MRTGSRRGALGEGDQRQDAAATLGRLEFTPVVVHDRPVRPSPGFFICLLLLTTSIVSAAPPSWAPLPGPPPIRRELRAAWIATKGNIDWPSKPGLPSAQQQRELIAHLDLAQSLGLNAVVLQVRPQGDALYPSSLEPWSEYLSGKEGVPPSPRWDPLAFAVLEAHNRGLELHAWINPFRARAETAKSPSAPNNLAKKRPDLAVEYGGQIWLNPGEPDVRQHAMEVITDLVRRYDIDALHMDDYFYPYPVKDGSGGYEVFQDDRAWKAPGRAFTKSDWRRANVDDFIQRASAAVHATKPWVQFGISPFGIWRNNTPPGIRGLDAFESLYADARRWIAAGWVDYLAPQLYWNIEPPAQSFPVLLDWWSAQNRSGHHLFAGIATARVGIDRKSKEIGAQLRLTRAQSGADGFMLWNMSSLVANKDGVSQLLRKTLRADPVLVPASPWLSTNAPSVASFSMSPAFRNEQRASWSVRSDVVVRSFALQMRRGLVWTTEILPPNRREVRFRTGPGSTLPDEIRLTPVGRAGAAGNPAMWRRNR
jgi:uncharacterized lipoprotein YddW (UPF0748 family)